MGKVILGRERWKSTEAGDLVYVADFDRMAEVEARDRPFPAGVDAGASRRTCACTAQRWASGRWRAHPSIGERWPRRSGCGWHSASPWRRPWGTPDPDAGHGAESATTAPTVSIWLVAKPDAMGKPCQRNFQQHEGGGDSGNLQRRKPQFPLDRQ